MEECSAGRSKENWHCRVIVNKVHLERHGGLKVTWKEKRQMAGNQVYSSVDLPKWHQLVPNVHIAESFASWC